MDKPAKHPTSRRLDLVVAMTSDYIIGYSNQLPWRLSIDLKRFRKLTTPHTVIMGRKTYESIGRPLPRRENIVVTRQKRFRAEGCKTAGSLEEAIAKASPKSRIFVIGGGQLYGEAMSIAERIYLTVIEADKSRPQGILFEPFLGDTRFPPIDASGWRLQQRGTRRVALPSSNPSSAGRNSADAASIYFRFVILERRKRNVGEPIPGVTTRRFDIPEEEKVAQRRAPLDGRVRPKKRAARSSQRDLFRK